MTSTAIRRCPTPSPSRRSTSSAAFVKADRRARRSARRRPSTGTMTIGPSTGRSPASGASAVPTRSTTMAIECRRASSRRPIGPRSGAGSGPADSPVRGSRTPRPDAVDARSRSAEVMRAIVSVTDVGVESQGGRQLHHLQSSGGNEIRPDASASIRNGEGRQVHLDFYATDDGTPAIMTVAGMDQVTATRAPAEHGDRHGPRRLGSRRSSTRPTDVWVRYTTKTIGYTMAHPADWTVESTKDEDTYCSMDRATSIVAACPTGDRRRSSSRTSRRSYTKPFKGEPASETPTARRPGPPSGSSTIHRTTRPRRDHRRRRVSREARLGGLPSRRPAATRTRRSSTSSWRPSSSRIATTRSVSGERLMDRRRATGIALVLVVGRGFGSGSLFARRSMAPGWTGWCCRPGGSCSGRA